MALVLHHVIGCYIYSDPMHNILMHKVMPKMSEDRIMRKLTMPCIYIYLILHFV